MGNLPMLWAPPPRSQGMLQPSPVLICMPGQAFCNQKVKAEFWYQVCAFSITRMLQQMHPEHGGLP